MPNLLTRMLMLIDWMERGNSLPGGESAIVQEAHDRIRELETKLAAAEEALESIVEYWNRDQNEEAMADALAYIIAIAEEAIDAARGEV